MAEATADDFELLELPVRAWLTHCDSGKKHEAQIVELTAKVAKTKMGAAWWSNLGVSKSVREQEGDHHWDWAAEIGKHRNSLAVESVAVESPNGDLQAAMIYRVDGQSTLEPGAGAVFIDRLATAPRNRDWLVDSPAFRGGGTTLLSWAAYQSYALGLAGRVVVATLPSPRSIAFYKSAGFKAVKSEKDGMDVFELESAAALNKIKQTLKVK